MAFSDHKNPGELIKSDDWNDAVDETVRLESAKVNRTGADRMTGPLTIDRTLGIGRADPQYSLDAAGWFRFGPGGDSGRIFAHYGPQFAPVLSLSDLDDPPRIQFQQIGTGDEGNPEFSSWIGHAGGRSTDIAIMDGNVGIGTTNPQAKLEVNGSLSVDSLEIQDGTTFSKIQAGTATVGSNAMRTKIVTVNFPVRFLNVPQVVAMPRAQAGTNWPDVFAVTTRSISQTQFQANVIRMDATGGWGQNLQLDWIAWESPLVAVFQPIPLTVT